MEHVDGVGLALCGGGFRSFSEVAALEDMERNHVPVGAVAGTSMGSLVAALVAAGVPAARMAELLVAVDRRVVEQGLFSNMGLKVLNMITGASGLVDSDAVVELARGVLADAGISGFADLGMPVAFPACDLGSSTLCVFTNDPEFFDDPNGNWSCVPSSGLDLATCIAASASYPLVISPTTVAGRSYIDGGCRMNLPTPLFERSRVDAVVGVGMIRAALPVADESPATIAKRALACGTNQLDLIYSQAADVYVNLPVSGDDAFQAGTGEQMIEEARTMVRESPIDWSHARPSALETMRRSAADAMARMLRPRRPAGQHAQQAGIATPDAGRATGTDKRE